MNKWKILGVGKILYSLITSPTLSGWTFDGENLPKGTIFWMTGMETFGGYTIEELEEIVEKDVELKRLCGQT